MKRSEACFKRVHQRNVDFDLDETVSKDAASRLGGIASFTQYVNVRKRWTLARVFVNYCWMPSMHGRSYS